MKERILVYPNQRRTFKITNCDLNKGRGSNFKYMPFAFTELGVAMLSSVLNSDTAIEMNRSIMRAFVAVHRFIANPPVDRVSELQAQKRLADSLRNPIGFIKPKQ